MKVLTVGGGGGGGTDGGSGGGGGELRYNATQSISGGTVITVAVGPGGRGGSWTGSYGSNPGTETTLTWSSAVQYRAKAGSGGGGWTTTSGGAGGSAGTGGDGTNGQQGGGGPGDCPFSYVSYGSSPSGTTPSNDISGATVNYGGGGGGGTAFNGGNTQTAGLGAAGGTNSGGRGSNYRIALDGVTTIDGASVGGNGVANTGGGGGGGSACNAGVTNGENQRTAGGSGADGIVVISYLTPPTISGATISGTQQIGSILTANAGTTTGTDTTTSYQWQFSTDNSSWTNIPSATNQTYAISGTTYRGNYLRVVITVTNSGGTASATSSATSLIYYPDCSTTPTTPTIDGVVRNVYSFTTTGTCEWNIPAGVSRADVLIVGGGGGGGSRHGGGGGAGGLVFGSQLFESEFIWILQDDVLVNSKTLS
jgi:hypothetical protein